MPLITVRRATITVSLVSWPLPCRVEYGARRQRRQHKLVKALPSVVAPALIALIALATAAATALADPIALETSRVRLNPTDRAQEAVGRLMFLGGLALDSEDRRLGGLSGLTLEPGGQRLVAVSDAGYWFQADVLLDDDGRLAGLENAALWPLRGADGLALEGKQASDAEAVEADGEGSYIVAFERDHRLWRYDVRGGFAVARPSVLALPPGLESAPDNRGVEALTVLSDGRVLAITEGARDGAGDLRGWLIDGGVAAPVGYRPTPFFRPTGLAVLPGGDVLVLERSFIPPASLAARLRIIAATDIVPGARLRGEAIAHLRPPLSVDNFEGLAVHRDERGRTILYVLSDDNYNALQRTLLLMFELAPP